MDICLSPLAVDDEVILPVPHAKGLFPQRCRLPYHLLCIVHVREVQHLIFCHLRLSVCNDWHWNYVQTWASKETQSEITNYRAG